MEAFSGSEADLEGAADNLFPLLHVHNLYDLKVFFENSKAVPPTPGMALQQKIETKPEKSLGTQFNIQLQQQIGVFQASMMEAFQCLRDEFQIIKKICISQKPFGAPMGKVPLPGLRELQHQARKNFYTINFTATCAKTASVCKNTTMEKCQDSFKSTFKKVKSQIQKGANPEKAARRGYENACDYLEVLNKRILIQQRA